MAKVWTGSGKDFKAILEEQEAFDQRHDPDVRTRRRYGTYWTKAEDVWTTESATISAADFDAISRSKEQGLLYEKVYSYLSTAARKSNAGSSQTHSIANTERVDFLGNLHCEAAHLLSNAPVCHKAYGFPAQAAVGFYADGDKCRIPLILGQTGTDRRKKMLKGVLGRQQTALKGHPYNKIYLGNQGESFDRDPSLLLIPLLSLQDIMGWASNEDNAIEYDVAVFTFGPGAQYHANKVLQYAPEECSDSDIELAKQNLETFVKGIAGCILGENVKEAFSVKELQSQSILAWSSLVDEIKSGRKSTIQVPGERIGGASTGTAPTVRIAKGRLTKGTSLADPWLMLLKTAVNYSVMEGNKLMPACSPTLDEGLMFSTQGDHAAVWADFYSENKQQEDHRDLLLQSLASGGTTTELYCSED
jgi:hypothetical protein